MGVILAIDPGEKFVGLAQSNPEKTLAFPQKVIMAKPKENLLNELKKLCADKEVDLILIGHPLSLGGKRLPMTANAEDLAEILQAQVDVKIELVDERLSTKQALQNMPKKDLRPDAQAAALFLQSYLDRMNRDG